MEIKANSFSLRGESGVVKVVSDSVFAHDSSIESAEDKAECDVIMESDGFRVNKTLVLEMSMVLVFLLKLREVVLRGSGSAEFLSDGGELSMKFIIAGSARIEFEMSDRAEGKANSIRVKYSIEPWYFEDLKSQLESLREYSTTDA